MPKWTSDTFKLKSNPDLTVKISELWKKINAFDKVVDLTHVYAHNKDKSGDSKDPYKKYCFTYNGLADELANIARDLPDYKIITI